MNLKRLKWLTVVVPVLALCFLEGFRHFYTEAVGIDWLQSLLFLGLVTLGAVLFSRTVFARVGHMSDRLASQTRRMEALLHVAQAINSSVELDEVLQTVIDQARECLKADHGEILIEDEGRLKVCYSGLDPKECPVKIQPRMLGLKGVTFRAEGPIRLRDRTDHPHSIPLPPGHPPIGPFLGVPIKVQGKNIAHIILTRNPGQEPFSQEDEDALIIVANQAAVAIEKGRLYHRIQEMAMLEERDRIAKELHDGLAQTLGYLNIKTLTVRENLDHGHTLKAQKNLAEIRRVIKEAYEEVRRAIFDLRATTIPERGFLPALQEYLYEFSLQTDIKVEAQLGQLEEMRLPLAAEIQLMRIIQEALNNVRKHSNASRIWVKVEASDGARHFIIQDNGRGFDVRSTRVPGKPHFGLQTMRERAESVGGSLKVESRPGQGTRVVVEIPYLEITGSSTDSGDGGDGNHKGAFGG